MRAVSVLLLLALSSAFVLINAYSVPKYEHECPKNQVWNQCGTSCPASCENVKSPRGVCIQACNPACFCKAPYILLSAKSRTCVLPQDCPKPPECPKNQEWNQCGTSCPVSCENVKSPPGVCIDVCKPACFCKAPYILLSAKSRTCVLPQDCPKPPAPKCPKNQHWDDKATVCQHNCQNKDVMFKCTNATMSGCFCNKGYVFKSGTSGPCVRPKDCPAPKCPKNQHWEENGIPCRHTCQNVGAVFKCTSQKESRCYCDEGYVYKSGSDRSCVRTEDCPKIKPVPSPKPAPCPGNMTSELPCTPCPDHCDESKNRVCPAVCIPPKEGCFCKHGYLSLDEEHRCVLRKDCPKK